MRLRDREVHYRQANGIITMEDTARARRADAAATKRAEEKRQLAAKQATKGQALPGIEVKG
jgi:hypothetical protein